MDAAVSASPRGGGRRLQARQLSLPRERRGSAVSIEVHGPEDGEDVSKLRASTSPRGAATAMSRVPIWIRLWKQWDTWVWATLGWVALATLVDPPFVIYFIYITGVILRVAMRCHVQAENGALMTTGASSRTHLVSTLATQRQRIWLTAASVFLINLVTYHVLQEFEIVDMTSTFAFPQLNLGEQEQAALHLEATTEGLRPLPTPRVTFLRMYNPKLTYTSKVEVIHQYINGDDTPIHTQRLEVALDLGVWTSDVFRYEFLRHVWRTTSPQQNHIFCLAESDMAFHEEYIASILAPPVAVREPEAKTPSIDNALEIAHAQHFWGHQQFEPFNIGFLCTSTRASFWTRQWTAMMSYLHRKRYRRLLYLSFLYALVPNRVVLYWDQYHGCSEYFPHCKYIHFTRPKAAGIEQAIKAIQLAQADTKKQQQQKKKQSGDSL